MLILTSAAWVDSPMQARGGPSLVAINPTQRRFVLELVGDVESLLTAAAPLALQ